MIKIVHIITETNTGGAETMLLRLLSCGGPDFENIVISLTAKGPIGCRIETGGNRLYSLNSRTGYISPFKFVELVKMLRRERPDIVQTWLYHADFFGILAAKAARVPAVLWNIRCSFIDSVPYPRAKKWALEVLKKLSVLPQAVIVNSQAGLRAHRKIGYRPRRWAVINNGFDLTVFRPRPNEKKSLKMKYFDNADYFLIGCVARFNPLKDHENFLKAIRIFIDRYDPPTNIRFVFVGSGIDTDPSLSQAIDVSGVGPWLIRLGEKTAIEDLMPAFDIYASSSCSEGFPNTIGEAMACGVPCVATDAGDSALLIGKTGIIVPVKDPESLARVWQEMILMGEEERQKRGALARQRIESDFSIEAISGRYKALYTDLAQKVSGVL